MKGSPFRTRRQFLSPFMLADPALGAVDAMKQEKVLQEPEVTPEQDLMQEPVVAPQMQDTDPYKGKAELYGSELDYATKAYGSSSIEDIYAAMEEGGINPYDLNAEQVFDYSGSKMGDYSILGDDSEFNEGMPIRTSKGVSKKIFQYGNIESFRQDDGSYIETISVTAENHPLYGNTYTRTKTENKERGTVKPIEDLNSVLSNYSYNNGDATAGVLGINTKGEKPKWNDADSNFEEALENGWFTKKDGSKLFSDEIAGLKREFKKASDRFKNGTVTSTKLNKK